MVSNENYYSNPKFPWRGFILQDTQGRTNRCMLLVHLTRKNGPPAYTQCSHLKRIVNSILRDIISSLQQYIYIYIYRDIGPAVRVFANGPGDLGSIPGRVIPKTLKMVLDTTLLNTQHYKARFKGKVEQSWEWSSALPYTLV